MQLSYLKFISEPAQLGYIKLHLFICNVFYQIKLYFHDDKIGLKYHSLMTIKFK